jgi:hypothetical protein
MVRWRSSRAPRRQRAVARGCSAGWGAREGRAVSLSCQSALIQ